MVLKILIIASILFQIIAVVVALRLTRVTKYNISWILFTVALIILTLARTGEFLEMLGSPKAILSPYIFVWLGVCTSLCFAVGMLFVQKIFKYIKQTSFRKELLERRLLHTVISTEEKERQRFSKELHDGLGPLLSSAKMSLSVLHKNELSPKSLEVLNNTQYVLEEAIRSLREISNNLSPHTLADFGLGKAIKNFIKKAITDESIKVNCTTNIDNKRFDTDIEVIFYRVICELLNNSFNHAKCSEINISLLNTGGHLQLEYTDNGLGFTPEAVSDAGLGLSNIMTRINSLKGQCEIISSPGNGMSAKIII